MKKRLLSTLLSIAFVVPLVISMPASANINDIIGQTVANSVDAANKKRLCMHGFNPPVQKIDRLRQQSLVIVKRYFEIAKSFERADLKEIFGEFEQASWTYDGKSIEGDGLSSVHDPYVRHSDFWVRLDALEIVPASDGKSAIAPLAVGMPWSLLGYYVFFMREEKGVLRAQKIDLLSSTGDPSEIAKPYCHRPGDIQEYWKRKLKPRRMDR
jgi:hypothetical protein